MTAAAAAARLRVGIEVHARILSSAKLFSRASAELPPNAKPNGYVDLLDYGLPGAMPFLNRHCVAQAIRAGIALHGQIQPVSVFERKHYTYCDQPLGYQITQQSQPAVVGGYVRLDSNGKQVRVSRIQIEQDTAKSMHVAEGSLLDFNRAGVGLLEIVSEPDLSSPTEASEYVRTLQTLLRHVGVCDGRMEEGSLRADVNISVGGRGARRVEVKNLNSLRSIERAVAFEQQRLAELPEQGGNETRGFDALTGQTLALRDKDSFLDYRFLPEPDLPPLIITPEDIALARASLAELPEQTRARLSALGLESYASMLISRPDLLALLDETLANDKAADSRLVCNWVCNVLGSGDVSKVQPSRVAELAARVQTRGTTTTEAKSLLIEFVAQGLSLPPQREADSVPGGAKVDEACSRVVASHPIEAERYRKGKKQLLNFFVGKAMAELKAAADAGEVRTAMQRLLDRA